MPSIFNKDPVIVSAGQFLVDTNWIVITGAPSAGKTSVIHYLAELGYTTTPEIARVCIENQDEAVTDIRSNEAVFQRMVTKKKLELEGSLNKSELVFLDRGMPDSVTYYRIAGLDPNEVAKECLRFRYRKVFLFERLALHDDGIRKEDDETSEFIQKWLEIDYHAFGYELISVPVMSMKLRAEFIIDNLIE